MKNDHNRLMLAEVADWHAQGLITATQAQHIMPRYNPRDGFITTLLKWLGLIAIFCLSAAILSLIAQMMYSWVLGTLALLVAAGACGMAGIKMATDPAARHPFSGSALVSIALMCVLGAFILPVNNMGDLRLDAAIPALLMLTGTISLGVAYRWHLRWPLLLALLFIFHGLGAWDEYGGYGAYFASIQTPRHMALIAALAAAFGLHHLRKEENQWIKFAGFGRLYLIFGLLYCNVSLWFLSLNNESSQSEWVLFFTLAAIAQIVLGARLHDSRLKGFGVVFLGIDMYTCFYSYCWDQLSTSSFFLLAGLAGMGLGWLFERQTRQQTEGHS